MKYDIEFSNQQARHLVSERDLVRAARQVLAGEGIVSAELSLAVLSDPAIHEVNRRYLQHDEPTDVISFLLSREGNNLEGEVIVSADTAAHTAARLGWTTHEELLLYVIHGVLHLCGYDDLEPPLKQVMRARERHYLALLGIAARYESE